MKNLTILFCLFTFFTNAQTIDVLAENSTIEFSGSTYDINSSGGQDVNLYLIFRNNTGTDQNWDLERVLPVMPHWDDWSMSWASYSNPLAGNDYILDSGVSNWITPIDLAVPQGDSVQVALRYDPLSDGCDLFKYYIVHNDVRVDSFSINICKTVSLNELNEENILVYSIPTNCSLNVVFEKHVPEQVVIFDLLGNKIANMEAFSSMQISTTDFSSGLYFLSWNDNGIIRKRKFQVQHSN